MENKPEGNRIMDIEKDLLFEKIISIERPECAVSEVDLLSVEQALDIRIPKILRDYYLRHNGAGIKTLYAFGCEQDTYGLHGIETVKYRSKYDSDNSVTYVDDGEGSFERTVKDFADYDAVIDNHLIPFAYDEVGEMYFWQEETSEVYIIYSDDFENPVKAFDSISEFFEAFARAADLKKELDDLKPGRSLEELENDRWGEPSYGSYVVTTSHSARQKPINRLTDEEIRLLIGQKIGLKYLLPIAVKMVESAPARMVTYYQGDLTKYLLELDHDNWKDNPDEFKRFRKVVTENLDSIRKIEEIPNDLISRMIDMDEDACL